MLRTKELVDTVARGLGTSKGLRPSYQLSALLPIRQGFEPRLIEDHQASKDTGRNYPVAQKLSVATVVD